MKKPEYMDIEFPAVLKDFKSAVRKYFLGLKSQNVRIRFSQKRNRKVFNYRISFVRDEAWTSGFPAKKGFDFRVKFLQDSSKK